MKNEKSSNALLIELVIVLFFFILSFAVLSQVFAGAYVTESRAETTSRALHDARNVNALMQTGSWDLLEEEAFREENGVYVAERDGYTLHMEMENESTSCGLLNRWTIEARWKGEVLFSLPGARYEVTGYE